MAKEKTTREVADLLGISVDLLRKYKARGFLLKAPQGVSGQGRSNQCMWSDEAIEELRAFLNIERTKATRYPNRRPRP
jgi:hypothetical protein